METVFNPTVVAAFLTALALIIQNAISGKREAKREKERQEHVEHMAALAKVSERELHLEAVRRERSAAYAKDISNACIRVLEIIYERDSKMHKILSARWANDPSFTTTFAEFLNQHPIFQARASEVALLDHDLGALCASILEKQHEVINEHSKINSASDLHRNKNYLRSLALIEVLTTEARETIRRAVEGNGSLPEAPEDPKV